MFVSPHILVVQFLLGICMRPHFTSRIWVVGAEDVVVVSGFATRRCDAPQFNLLGDSLVHFELSDTCVTCLSVLHSFAQLVPTA